MRKYILFGIVLGLVVFFIAARPSLGSVNNSLPIDRVCGEVCEEIYTDLNTGEIRYRIFDSPSIFEGMVVVDIPANSNQIFQYQKYVERSNAISSLDRLNSEVESGKKIPGTLRDWSNDAQTAYENWPVYSDAEKNATNREVLRRLSIEWSKLADFIEIERYGK